MRETIKPLLGYSGAQLLTPVVPGAPPFVRKVAANPAHNARLRVQMQRQLDFHDRPSCPFRVPAVLGEGFIEERFYFDMEFVSALNGTYFLATAPIPELRRFRDHLVETFSFLARNREGQGVAGGVIDALLAKVSTVAAAEPRLKSTTTVRILDWLNASRAAGASTWDAHTLYHGDFSLENILVTKEQRIVLIDFLDSPLPHYWQDLAKIHLDLEVHWYARRNKRIPEWVTGYLRAGLREFSAAYDPGYLDQHGVLVAINLLRILPYAKTEADREFLIENIEDRVLQL